jgi:hypothetical protein
MNSRVHGIRKTAAEKGEAVAFGRRDEFYRFKHLYKADTTVTRGSIVYGRKGGRGDERFWIC